MIDFRNVNTLWTSILVETLCRCGLKTAVICPGSRSTPLTVAFASHPEITTIPILDERSAAFFALGRGKKTGLPTVLVCTSGTAGANFYPAVIEAKESSIPLIILTADRPPELRNCHAGQTIDQIKLYGNLPNWQCELAVAEANLSMLRYLRQNVIQVWRQSLLPSPGVVHLNIPLREPLAPIKQPLGEITGQLMKSVAARDAGSHDQLTPDFFDGVEEISKSSISNTVNISLPWHSWLGKSGIIIAGLAQPPDPEAYCQAIALLSQRLSFPVLAEALSPLRNYARLNPYLISTYDAILRQMELKQLIPEVVIQIGELPTSKQLRHWLQETDVTRWIIDPKIDNFDPLHGKSIHLNLAWSQITDEILPESNSSLPTSYCQHWCELESVTRSNLDHTLASLEYLYEGKAAWLISQTLPPGTPIFLANSMSVRHAEFFWQPNNRQIVPFFSRGANGIDGTLSTALGMAYQDAGVLLTGDLALLHDTNGFLISQKFQGHLTIIVINNNGGGIFEMLPIASFPQFEEYFATPQAVDLPQLCAAYGIEHHPIGNWPQLTDLIANLPSQGIRVLELKCDRSWDATWLSSNMTKFSM
ncbi:MAG: 2-succinyl-5-enolpyruvyl-6-hydroxy-3-cyclohexene-1-carboxylic-acid synthase [Cyanobacteria bacterium J06642_3]